MTTTDSPKTDWEPMNTPDDAAAAPDAAEFGLTQEVVVDARPDTVYDLISDVANIDRWSPTAGDAPHEGQGRRRRQPRLHRLPRPAGP